MRAVSLAVIVNDRNEYLLTQRGLDTTSTSFWEFPGGKIESGESPEAALVRECHEELNIQVQSFHIIHQYTYQYPDKILQFFVYQVDAYQGTPHCCVGQQALHWVSRNNLKDYNLLPASFEILPFLSRQCPKTK